MDAGLVAKPPCCRVILDVVTASGSDACPVLTRGKQSSGDVSAASSGYARFVLYNRMLCQCNHCGGDGEITDLQCSARSLRSLLLLSWRAPVSTSVHCAGPALQTASRCRDQAPCMRPGHRRRGQTLRRSLASGTAGAWEGACCPGPPPPSFCELRRLACKAVSLPSPSHDTMPLNSGNQVAATTDPARPLPQQEEQVDGGRRRLAGRALRSGSIAKLAPFRVSSRRANRTRARCTAAIAPS